MSDASQELGPSPFPFTMWRLTSISFQNFRMFPSGCTRVVAAKAEVSCHQGSLSPRLPHLAIALNGLLSLHSASRFCKKLAIHSLSSLPHQVHKWLDLENPADFGIPRRLAPDCHPCVCSRFDNHAFYLDDNSLSPRLLQTPCHALSQMTWSSNQRNFCDRKCESLCD